jgi:Sec7-like guanine-nucleotide exchange factor
MWPPAPALFQILVITWITARKYAHTLMSATTLKTYQDSTYKLIDSFTLTCDVASSSQLRTKTYLALLALLPLPSVAPGTSVVYPFPYVAQSLIFSVSCKFSVSRTFVISHTYKLMTLHTTTASSYNNHTLATTLKMCHVSNSLILDTVTLTCYAALLSPLKLATCTKSLLFIVIACNNTLRDSNILISNVFYSYNP